MPTTLIDADALKYSQALDDSFPFFLREVFIRQIGAEPTRTQMEMADWLQHGPLDRGVLAYREAAKTYEIVAYILWRIRKNPKAVKSKLASETEGHSVKSLLLARGWIQAIPFLNHLKPPSHKDSLYRANATELDVAGADPSTAPSIHAIGITGQVTGGRSNLTIADDCETSENTTTIHQRQLLINRMEELEFLGREGDRIILGTYHHEESLYLHQADHGYEFRAWPARHPTDEQRAKIRFLAPQVAKRLDTRRAKPGEPLDPLFASNEMLTRQELKVGKSRAEQQLMLIPGASDVNQYPLKQADLIVFDAGRDKAPASLVWGTHTARGSTICEDLPVVGFAGDGLYRPIFIEDDNWQPYQGIKAFLDPAGTGDDELAWAVAAQLNGYVHLRYVGAVNDEGSKATIENLTTVAESLREHGAQELWIESNFGGDMLAQLIKPIIHRLTLQPLAEKQHDPNARTNETYPNGWACAVHTIHHTTQKELRIINTLEPVMNQHRLVVTRQVAQDTILMRQLTRITKQRNCLELDDRLDAASGVVQTFKTELDQDPQEAAERQRQADREAIWNQWLKDAGLTQPNTQQGWIHY